MSDQRDHQLNSCAKIVAETRMTIGRSLRLLRECPKPDTFLGRKTQEPFPMREEE